MLAAGDNEAVGAIVFLTRVCFGGVCLAVPLPGRLPLGVLLGLLLLDQAPQLLSRFGHT